MSGEHEKALNDLAQHTGDSTTDRLERLKRIEQLRLQGYQKVKSLSEEKSGTSPTRRSYTSFSQETSPSFYGSLGRINHLEGVKPKSYSSKSFQDPTQSLSQRTRSSSLSDDDENEPPKQLLRSKSATTVSDTGLTAFEFGGEQNISYNPMGSEEEHWRERNDSYNEEDENIEDFKKSLYGDTSFFAKKSSPRTDRTLKAFSLSREWSSGGAEYEDSEGQGHRMEAGEDNSETFSMFPSYNSEFLGMNYGETFENPNSYGTTIRKSFSRERSRQPLLRSFSSQNETAPNSSLGYSAESRRNTSRLDSVLDQIFTPSAVTTERSSLRSSGYDRQGRLDSALDSLYSRGGSTRDISGPSSRLRDHYTSGSDSSYTERKKIGLSSEAESKLDQLFGPPTSSVLSNRPSFTSTSRRSETPAVRSRADRITITRIKSNSTEGRQMGVNYLIDQNRESLYRASDVPSTMVYGGENYNTSQITEDTRVRQHSAQSSLDQKLDNLFNVPDVLSTSMMDRENSMETDMRENPIQSTDLDQKLDSLFQVPNDLSTSMMKNESSKLTQSRRQVLNNKAKPTLTSMLYGEENHSMEPGEITETMEDFTDTWYVRSLVDGDMNDTNMDNLEYVDQAPVSEIEILGDVPEEVSLLEKITEEEDIGTEICGNHGDGEEYVNEEETQGLMNDLTHGSETVEISQNLPQSDEGVKTEVSPDKSQVTNGQVTKGQVTNGQVTRVQQNQMSTKGKQADSKKNKKKSKGKKNKGKKGQKEKVDKVDENPMTAKDCGKRVLETDIDAALGQVDQQNIDNVVEETSSLCVELSERQNSVERENSVSAEKIQKTEEGESNIDLENEEEENYVEANEATERYRQLQDEGAKEEVLKDEKKSDVESETITENEVNQECKETEKSSTENTSWFRSKFNSLIHGFGTDSNANKIENEAQQKLENIQTVSKSEDVSTVNGDMNMNVATASDTGTVSEDDYATASDNDTTKVNDEYYETDYNQSVLNSNLKNDKISSEVSSENEALDILNELAATTGMSLDRGEQFEDCGDVKGQVMYEREEEILRGDKEKIPGNIVEFEDNGWNVVVKQQEMRSQNKEHVMLSDGINKMEEMDLNYQENRHNLPQLGTNLLNKNEAGVSCQMDVKPSVCTTEISIQTDVEAYLTIDKVSTSVQTLPCKLDKWTQTDMETVVESKELGIQASPATADYSDQYNVSVKDSGVQVVHKCETEQVQVDLKTVPEHVKPEQLVSEQMVSKQFSSEQVVPECLSSSQQVKLEHLSSEQIHLKQHSSQQVKLEHLSSEQTQSKLSSGPVKLVKPEQLSSEPVKSGVRVDSTLIVTDKVTPEYAVAEHIKIERVVPEQVKMVSRQTSRTAEDISSTMSSNHMNEDLLKDVGHSSDVKPEVKVPDVNVKNSGRPGDTKVSESVEGQVTVTSSETINAWSKPVAASSEISFSSQSLSKKGPPQTLPKRRSKHGGSKPSSRPSSFVAEGDGFDFHSSEQSAANLESSSFNFNKILPKTETTAPKMTSEKTESDNTKVVGIVKSEVSSPLSPRAKEFGMIPTGSSGTLLTAVVGPKSPRSQLEHGLDGKEWSSTSASSNTGVTSPRSSLSGMSSLSSHGNKGHVKSPPPALLPKRKATTQLQMPTSPKSPTSPRSSEKVELWQEYDPVFTKQMKMNNGEQKIVKEPINRLKDNPFIRKDGNVKTGRQESFSKKCETLTTSKPRTLSSSLTPKSPKEEHKRSGDIPTQGKDTAVDLNVLDSKSLRLEIIRQSTSRSNTKNVTKGTKNVENTKSKMETSTDSSVRKASESSTIVNKIISDAAKFEAKFSSGSNQNVEASSALGCVPLERDNPFIMSEKGTSGTESIKTSFHSSSLIEHHQSYMETSIDGEEEPNFTVSHTEKVVSEAGGDRRNSSVTQADNLDDTDISTVIQTDKIQDQEQENKIVPPQRKRKLRVEVPSPVKSGDSLESEDAPDSPSLASLVSSELQEIGVGEIAGLSMKPAKSQKSSSTNGVKVNVEIAQQNAAQQQPSPKTGKPPSPLSGKPPSPKTGKPPSPKTGKTPSPKVGKPSSPSKEQPSGENRPLSPRVGKTPPSPQNRKSPSPKLTTPSTPKGSKQKSSSTPPSPGGRPMSPRVKQSPLSKAMFGDRENGKSGNNVYSDTRSRRRSSEKTGSISSRTSSVSSEGSSSTIEKVDAKYEMHMSDEEKRGVAIDDDEDDEVLPSRINLREWDPTKLLCDLYTVKLAKEEVEDVSDKYIGMEGLMEKLPMNKKKATLLKTWKRRFFRAKDGWLHYFETNNRDRPSDSVQLMGGRIDDLGNRILGIDDGRGRYLMVRCPTDKEYGQWKMALESQTVDNVRATYVRPVLKSPPNTRRKVVLIDIGSCSIRAGILGQEASLPEIFFPSMVARNKDSGEIHIGMKAYHPDIRKTSALMKAVRPTSKMDKSENVFNVDTEVMPAVLQKIFTDLNVDPSQYWIMMSTPQNLADQLKASLFEIFIGQFRVKGVCMVMQSLLALYSYQKTSGILVDIGQRMEILPICDGYVIEGGVSRQSYGGQKVEDNLNNSLTENKYVFVTPVEQLIVRHIKEQSCYVAEDYEDIEKKCASDPESCQSTVFLDKYNLPEGAHRTVTHDRSCYHSPEGFFNTDLWGMDYPCVHNLVYKAIQFCPIDSRKHMYRAIYLSGGVTMLPGFAERLQKELIKLAPPSVIVEVHASPQRYHSAYIGACSLANMDMFEQSCITGDEWARNGVKAFAKWAMQSS